MLTVVSGDGPQASCRWGQRISDMWDSVVPPRPSPEAGWANLVECRRRGSRLRTPVNAFISPRNLPLLTRYAFHGQVGQLPS